MAGILHFSGGRVGTFDCGFTAPMRQWLEITGTTGVIRVPEMWVPHRLADYIIERDGREPERVEVPARDQIACMLEDFGKAVREGREPEPSPDGAVKTLRVLDALARSAREGKLVDV
jgi:predicted dehydrogenase